MQPVHLAARRGVQRREASQRATAAARCSREILAWQLSASARSAANLIELADKLDHSCTCEPRSAADQRSAVERRSGAARQNGEKLTNWTLPSPPNQFHGCLSSAVLDGLFVTRANATRQFSCSAAQVREAATGGCSEKLVLCSARDRPALHISADGARSVPCSPLCSLFSALCSLFSE